MGLKPYDESHRYLATFRLNYNHPQQKETVNKLLLWMEEASKSIPEGEDPLRVVIMELVEFYEKGNRGKAGQFGDPLQRLERLTELRIDDIASLIQEGFQRTEARLEELTARGFVVSQDTNTAPMKTGEMVDDSWLDAMYADHVDTQGDR